MTMFKRRAGVRGLAFAGVAAAVFHGVMAHAQSTWDGGGADDNWGTAANWVGDQVPPFPTEIAFGGGTRLTPSNNLNNVSASNITFNAGAGAFVLGGNPFTLGEEGVGDYRSNGIDQLDDSLQTINNNLTLSRGQRDITTTNAGGGLALNGTIARNAGSAARFEPAAGSTIKTTLTNTNGLIGGWATIKNPSPADPSDTFLFAKVDASGNVVPYLDYTAATTIDATETTLPAGTTAASNLRWKGGGAGVTIAAPGVTQLNTFLFDQDLLDTVDIGAGNTLRFTSGGGIFRSAPTGAQAVESLRFAEGSITAGNSNAPAELNIWTSTTTGTSEADPGEQHNFTISLTTANITDNPEGGKVAVIKNGPGAVRTSSTAHTFSGGLYLNRGVWRAQANMGAAFGAGPVYVASGAQAYVNADGAIPNDFHISGTGINEGAFHVGAIRIAADGAVMNGKFILTSDARIGNRGAGATAAELGTEGAQGVLFNGQITGNYDLELSVFNPVGAAGLDSDTPTMIFANSTNDWGGNTTMGRGRLRVGGAGEVIPHGPGKGNFTLQGDTASESILTLDSHVETLNGLTATGDTTLAIVTNSTEGLATLRVGAADATSTFAGAIMDHVGKIGVTKIGSGTFTMTGANAYTGDTRAYGGTLSLQSTAPNLSSMSDVHITTGAVLNLGFTGTAAIDNLYFDGVPKAAGTWGSLTSAATNKDARITGEGLLQVAALGTAIIPGDFNVDNKVDLADLAKWKGDFGAGGGSDGDFDGDSDGNDFLIWQRRLGQGAPAAPATAAVPEPASLALLGMAVVGLAAARKRT